MWKYILVALFCGSFVSAKTDYRVCRPRSVPEQLCINLQRGDSKVKCENVSDGTDCALKLIKAEADFGVFTAEELFLAYQFYPNGFRLLHQLKHESKQNEKFETQMVALVSVLQENTSDNINSLKGGGFCHPGFNETQSLNDNILKQFERSVPESVCNKDVIDAENEIRNLKKFFGKSCRPGLWIPDSTLDATLKRKYPELCSLCDDQSKCVYNDDSSTHGHFGALKCLKDGKGKVAYVALSHAKDYVKSFPSKVPIFQMLCRNGTLRPFETENPCTWITRSWNVIAARADVVDELQSKLEDWLNKVREGPWIDALKSILLGDHNVAEKLLQPMTMPGSYLSENGASLEPPEHEKCGKDIKWCTISELEENKCKWVASETAVLGITPKILCEQRSTTFECLHSISDSKSDIMTIDSNYGYVARKLFSLSTLVYADAENDKNNVVLAVVKDSASSKFSSLQDLKGKKACFPEYGGISWMSFLNVVRANKLVPESKSCDFKKIASEIWSQACVPGIQDSDHSLLHKSSKTEASSLCSLCSQYSCAVSKDNTFYGDNGAFRCLEYDVADIAFIKPKNLNDSTGIENQYQYRILCKNGSLAINTGFDVDDDCAWSITIDSEVVTRKDVSDVDHTNMALALLNLHKWLGADLRTPIHIYESFNNTKNLLFKDSTVGLESTTSAVTSVQAYKKLMMDAEECSSAAFSFISVSILLMTLIVNRVL